MGIGCIPWLGSAVYARRASGQIRSRICFNFCFMTLFIGALRSFFPQCDKAPISRGSDSSSCVDGRRPSLRQGFLLNTFR